ncbi:unnamed protein product [Symbiodinium pilosum]|uniref:Uncharacterized protein n=1 Tax=Symbiodinium pilosum TaxID=2952 RepID=A0A812SEX7_SYMPI|nr:unnamed protein product [Symbiodinium pilosum]
MHPCVHPGATSERPASQGSRALRTLPSRDAAPPSPPARESDPQIAVETETCDPNGERPDKADLALSSTSSLMLSKARRSSPKKMQGSIFFTGQLEASETEEDRLFGTTSREEELFQAAEAEAAALKASWERGRQHRDPPDMIERLGDLMALLGPRYRTLPREAVWEKAVAGSSTAMQRREKRLGRVDLRAAAAALGNRSRGQTKARPPSPERLQDYDPDGSARAAWLRARDREQEGKALVSRIKSVSTLPSMQLPSFGL